MSSVVVLKFGGSSLATEALREIAASRVLDVVRRGESPVVVCSAIGRAPDPYATDRRNGPGHCGGTAISG